VVISQDAPPGVNDKKDPQKYIYCSGNLILTHLLMLPATGHQTPASL